MGWPGTFLGGEMRSQGIGAASYRGMAHGSARVGCQGLSAGPPDRPSAPSAPNSLLLRVNPRMFKLLVLGLLFYIAWRLFSTPGLLAPRDRKPLPKRRDDDYTDYEEVER